jgi:hypothetical protein
LFTGWVLVSPLARTIAALLAVRHDVIGPILAGVRSPDWAARPPSGLPRRVYETLRIGMQTLVADLGITTSSAAA